MRVIKETGFEEKKHKTTKSIAVLVLREGLGWTPLPFVVGAREQEEQRARLVRRRAMSVRVVRGVAPRILKTLDGEDDEWKRCGLWWCVLCTVFDFETRCCRVPVVPAHNTFAAR
jgi:hypothetical protein